MREAKTDRLKIGERIKLLRVLSGLRQDTLAYILTIPQKSIAIIESGGHIPNIEGREILSKLFFMDETFFTLPFRPAPTFSKKIVYFYPLKPGFTSRRYNETMKVLNALLPDFLVSASLEHIYRLSYPASLKPLNKLNYAQMPVYIFKLKLSYMIIDVSYTPHLLDGVMHKLGWQTKNIEIDVMPEIPGHLPDARQQLVYYFLNNIKIENREKIFNDFVNDLHSHEELKNKFLLIGLARYIHNFLRENLLTQEDFIEILVSLFRKWDFFRK